MVAGVSLPQPLLIMQIKVTIEHFDILMMIAITVNEDFLHNIHKKQTISNNSLSLNYNNKIFLPCTTYILHIKKKQKKNKTLTV